MTTYYMILNDETNPNDYEFRGTVEASCVDEAMGVFGGCADAYTREEAETQFSLPSYLRRGDSLERRDG